MATNSEQAMRWAMGYLKSIGAPASGSQDPRMSFLESWYNHEGVGGTNPLSITNAEGQAATDLSGNTAGVKVFKTVAQGYKALTSYFENQGITGLLGELKNPQTSVQALTQQLASAHWEGSATPQAVQASQQYAQTVGGNASNGALNANDVGGTTSTTSTPTTPPVGGGFASGPNTSGLPSNMTANFNQTYTGPNAYKGFDLTAIAQGGSPEVMKQVKNAIDYYTANPQLEQQMISDIYKAYGTEAWVANIPEIRTLLVAGTYNDWEKDPALFTSLLQGTSWYKTTAPSVRLWQENLANDPAAANKAVQQASARVTDIANSLGVPLTSAQVQQIGTQVAQMSIDASGTYVNGLYPDQNIYQMVGAAFNAQTFQQGLGQTPDTLTPGPTSSGGAVTAPGPGGDAAYLYNQFSSINRNYMLGMSQSALADAVQKAIASDTGQANFLAGQVQGFQANAQATAQHLFPAFANAIGTSASGGNDQTPYAATAAYRNIIATYTGQANSDTVNLLDPQWSWVLSGKPPPTSRASGILSPSQTGNGGSATAGSSATPTPPTLDQMQQYLMGTPQFQTTDMAKNMAWHVGSQILRSFGYN